MPIQLAKLRNYGDIDRPFCHYIGEGNIEKGINRSILANPYPVCDTRDIGESLGQYTAWLMCHVVHWKTDYCDIPWSEETISVIQALNNIADDYRLRFTVTLLDDKPPLISHGNVIKLLIPKLIEKDIL